MAASIEKIGEKIDYRDERQRKFTLRMFSISISVTGISVLGVLIKVLDFV
jgi:predicted nucleic acid-binding Zn ribbon protein